jgi:hypothetical protein
MFARYHGERTGARGLSRPVTMSAGVALAADATSVNPVDSMFPQLQGDPNNFLEVGPTTIAALRELGQAMAEDPSNEEGVVPAAYTYFGQFIDHDVTKTVVDDAFAMLNGRDFIEASDFLPMSLDQVRAHVHNERTGVLDLDSVYGGIAATNATNVDGSMLLGQVTPSGFGPINTADRFHDLPRRALNPNPQNDLERQQDREALIGDPRNDENLLVAQLHVAILRSHNAILAGDSKLAAPQVRSEVRRRYQWAVLHDFLPRVCDPAVVQDISTTGRKLLNWQSAHEVFVPIEFSAAAYRFGHSMVRQEYDHNSTFGPPPALVRATFNFMFTFTALSGDLSPGPGPNGESPTLPDNWTIDWARFFDSVGSTTADSLNPARKIDTRIAPELGRLPDVVGQPLQSMMAQLATRNLLRGYRFGLPTGQAVAKACGVQPLSPNVIADAVVPSRRSRFAGAGFDQRTPLWFYILAEAGDPAGPNGLHLGPVGSRIVAETLFALVQFSPDSVLITPPTAEELATGQFSLRGLIRLGLDKNLSPI